MTEPDFKFCPLRLVDGRLVVASEEEWNEFGKWCNKSTFEGKRICQLPPTIEVDLECLFAGHEGDIFYQSGELMANAEQLEDDIYCPSLSPSDIQTRFFQTIEGSKAEFYLWLGNSVDWFVNESLKNQHDMGNWSKYHYGTTKANESKVEAIKHLVKGIELQ